MISLSPREVALIVLFQLPWLLSDFFHHRKCCCDSFGQHETSLTSLKCRSRVASGSKGKFTVLGPQEPITALVGGKATFHCHLCPQKDAEDMEVKWFHEKHSDLIHHYKDKQDQMEYQIPEYKERTEFLRENISSGNVALRLSNIHPSDEGKYLCQFKSPIYSHEAEFQVHVAGIGSTPHIHTNFNGADRLRLTCTSTGWYPKPEAQWRNIYGVPLLPMSKNIRQKDDGLFSVEMSIVVSSSLKETISCFIWNPLLKQEKEAKLIREDNLLPETSSGIIPLLICVFIAGIFLFFTYYDDILQTVQGCPGQARRPLEGAGWDGTFLLPCTQEQASPGDMQKEQRGIASISLLGHHEEAQPGDQKEVEWNLSPSPDILKKPDLQSAQKHRVDVTLDADTAHPYLLPRMDGKSVFSCSQKLKKTKSAERFETPVCVLGKERFISGKFYWEVQVEDKMKWTLGLCKNSVCRKGGVQVTPEAGFWTISLKKGNEYWALSSPQTRLHLVVAPKIVGIFLDYEAGQISFYNVTDGTHIYTFQDTFNGALRPCICPGPLSIWENIVPITIPSQSQATLKPSQLPKTTQEPGNCFE
ncbi:butyrophilin subfamily 1 member A1-like isoform X2 [Phascolarctos cinereus]|uniref:Butyrophilin subfamily 1 member A1-like isoform X2 n=1 Tax=Phascolarctos cinereus TaxID=38626 RepID=A0A6P5JBT0_PHACI|nr:butyrophilin subfamily 1 member A1-like isoform X2 [Phascolarctos cinereus]